MSAPSLTLHQVVRAPRERVFQAFLNPKDMVAWFKPHPGIYAIDAQADPQPGGAYTITLTNPENETFSVSGQFQEVVPHELVSFTWAWNNTKMDGIGPTLVRVRIEEHPEGSEVILVHEGFPEEASRDAHIKGWTGCMETLGTVFSA